MFPSGIPSVGVVVGVRVGLKVVGVMVGASAVGEERPVGSRVGVGVDSGSEGDVLVGVVVISEIGLLVFVVVGVALSGLPASAVRTIAVGRYSVGRGVGTSLLDNEQPARGIATKRNNKIVPDSFMLVPGINPRTRRDLLRGIR
jgi:hypothetical protein